MCLNGGGRRGKLRFSRQEYEAQQRQSCPWPKERPPDGGLSKISSDGFKPVEQGTQKGRSRSQGECSRLSSSRLQQLPTFHRMSTSAKRENGPISSARALVRGRQRSLVGSHDTTFFFAGAHLIGRDAVFIVLNRAFVVAARVFFRRVCCACGEQGCTRHNRHCHRNTNSHR